MIMDFADKPVNEVRVNKHPKRHNNEIVAAMYAAYAGGKSLAEIACMYHKTRQAIFELFHSRGYDLRHKPMKGMRVIDGVRYVEMRGGYLRGTVAGVRVFAHKEVWRKAHGEIPGGCVVRFRDGCRANLDILNLESVRKEEMPRIFVKHRATIISS